MHIDINTLSRETGVNVRTIRYYVSEGLLSPPTGRGPAAAYGVGHRDRLRLIRRLQDAHLPLREIKAKLASLDDAGVAAALAEATVETEGTPASASDYVRQVLGKSAHAERKSHSAPAPQAQASSAAAKGSRTTDPAPERSTWERIAVHPAIELHVRRPLSRADQRRLEALLEQAQRLFTEDP